MTEHDPHEPQDSTADQFAAEPGSTPTSDEHTREPETPDHDERLHRYDPNDDGERTSPVPPVGTWHREGRAASEEGAAPAGAQAGWQAPSAQTSPEASASPYGEPPTAPVIPPPPTEQTSAFGPFTFRHDDPTDPAHVAREEKRRGRNRTAGVLVGALRLGSAGGVVGAAAYSAANDDQSPTSTVRSRV